MAKNDITKFLTADQAAEIMGVGRRHVLSLVKAGKLDYVRLGWVHLIRESAARAYVRDPRGRPKQKKKPRRK